MRALISRSRLEGSVAAPPSKSYTIRGLMIGALAAGRSHVLDPLGSDDTTACTRVLRQIGARIRKRKRDWTIDGGDFRAPDSDLDCGDSAATLRSMAAVCSIVPGTCKLTAGPSLSRRPQAALVEALRQLGVECMSDGGLPPITVSGGKLKGGVASLPGDISSQFVTAILMVAPFAEKDVTVRVTTPLESKPYVLMTMDAMQWFGVTVGFDEAMREFQIFPQKYQPTKFSVEGDWTSASYPLAAGALAGRVQVTNLPAETMQGDRMIVDFIREMGGRVSGGHGWFTVSQSSLRPLAADLSDCIDLLPTAAILAAVADGTSRLTGLKRARIKESDRVQAVAEGLKNMDILVDEEPDSLTIVGGTPRGAVIDSKGDHRIAMAFSLLGAVAGETIIEGAECVSKTYPEFWDMLTLLGGKVQLGK